MSNWVKFVVIFSMLAISSGAVTIPSSIEQYLKQHEQSIKDELNQPFNEQEYALMAKKMAEKLIDRYASTIENLDTIKDELQQELSELILKTIFPSTNQSEKALEPISANLRAIIDPITAVYPGTLDGNMLRINYKNAVLPLSLSLKGTNGLVIKFHGASLRLPKGGGGYANQCLNLKIDLEKSSAKIDYLGTTESACALPLSKGEGEYLLKLAEDISRALHSKNIELQDLSRVLCKSSLTLVDLRILRIFQNKTSWYQSKDYEPISSDVQQAMLKQAQSLHAIKLSHFIEVVASKIPSAMAMLLEKMAQYKKSVSNVELANSFAGFMAWLWDHDCSAYVKIFDYLYLYEEKTDGDYLAPIDLKMRKDLTK